MPAAMKIAIVDDEKDMRQSISQWLALSGYDTEAFASAEDALKSLGPDYPGIVVTDVRMPGMDGIELTRHIRATAHYVDTPIVMLTAMAEKRYVDSAFAAGATDFVNKPFEVAELRSRIGTIEEMLAKRHSRTSKIFAAKTVTDHANVIELYEPISIYDVDSVIEYIAMENYVAQLSRSALFGSSTFAFTIREIEDLHATLTPFEFYSMISDVAEVISDTLAGRQFLMSYAGNGTFVCVTESGWRPNTENLKDAVNLSLSRTELYNNQSELLEPRVCVGEAVRLIWKSGSTALDALATAHASAEAACIAFEKSKYDFWNVGQTA